MSENELNENEEKLENAIPDNDYTMDVKQGFFSRIFNRQEQPKALNDPNKKVKVVVSPFSIDFMWRMRTLRADAMEWIGDRIDDIKNLFSGNKSEVEEEVKNTMNTKIIGQDEPELTDEQVTAKNQILQRAERIVNKTADKGQTLINNSKTAEDIRKEAEEKGVSLEELELNDDFDKALVEEEKKQETPQPKTGMEAGEISVGQELHGPNGPAKDDQEVR